MQPWRLSKKHGRWALLALTLVSLVLYAGSIFLPALILKGSVVRGTTVLAFGWWGLLALNVAWVANPLYGCALIHAIATSYQRARWRCALALLLSGQSWFAQKWWYHEGWGTPIESLGSGYYLWTLSMLVLLLAAHLGVRLEPPRPPARKVVPLSARWKVPDADR